MATPHALAALVADLEDRLGIDGAGTFAAFPAMPVSLEPHDLIVDAGALERSQAIDAGDAQRQALLNEEALSLLLNQVPARDTTVPIEQAGVWSIYERVIRTADLPLDELDDERVLMEITRTFANYRTAFDLAERASVHGDGGVYFPTRIVPAAENLTWTRIELSDSRFEERCSRLTDVSSGWLTRAGIRDALPGTLRVTDLSVEIAAATVARSWLDAGLFTNRAWKWDDRPLSDGGAPPDGILPAYATGVVFARDLALKVAAPEAGPTAGALAPPSIPVVAPRRFRDIASATARTRSTAPTHGVSASPAGAARFPVPVRIDASIVSGAVSADLEAVRREQASLRARHTETTQSIARAQKHIDLFRAELRRFPGKRGVVTSTRTVVIGGKPRSVTKRVDLDRLRQRLEAAERELQQVTAILAATDAAMDDSSRLAAIHTARLADLEQLSAPPVAPTTIFVLCFVCDRLPRSPDPEPRFFLPASAVGEAAT